MGELANCVKCGKVYVKTEIRELCYDCFREEEEAFEKVRRFINKRENRTASMKEISEGTGVPEELVLKFIKRGRLNIAACRMWDIRVKLAAGRFVRQDLRTMCEQNQQRTGNPERKRKRETGKRKERNVLRD